METPYDWITVAIFAGLVVLFMQRSVAEEPPENDTLAPYLIAGLGCAVANYFGNNGHDLIAIFLLFALIAFILKFLKPFTSIR